MVQRLRICRLTVSREPQSQLWEKETARRELSKGLQDVGRVRETESLGRGQNATVLQGRDKGCALT